MDEFEKIVEKYRRELMEFSKSCGNNITDDAECEKNPPDKSAAESEESEEKGSVSDTAVPVQDSEKTSNSDSAGYSVPRFSDYDDFIKNNSQSGVLRVQAFAAGRVFPVASAKITVALELRNETREMFEGLSDINGIIDNIPLPAPEREMSQTPSESAVLPYSSYTIYVEHPDFVSAVFRDVPVFSGTKSIQGVELIPLVSAGGEPSAVIEDESESFSRLKGDD